MKNDQLTNKLNSLERKLKVLLNEHSTLRQEVEMLSKENEELKSVIKRKDEDVQSYQNKLNISTIVNSIEVENTDTSELRALLNSYIEEIDKCIAYLSIK
ncbi:hypothetical protein [Aureibacter tunicatorum]|uniref:tRNA threonylcarbamoyladenosine modification (KEOPS) complex Pcc1 subunit n=1 Tax=Aureibacter tunicatorum TaxID=866807 RepID=A0AAE3XRM0_9BACT|nr:hypothetical protein [Aureibacter tunicatorum]MDR6240184.1 tRNA threonylcarbamoyladenosine modification (KEOPS) complex Pcc1 subunit [Aureibacter tunicatorum]BDD05935.1 hypothetical protein AUTU_34180 [Aureibacter tunicatorum]